MRSTGHAPTAEEIDQLFAGCREELVSCRKFAPAARNSNYAVARLAADVGLQINEARMFDLNDVRWEPGRYPRRTQDERHQQRHHPQQRPGGVPHCM